MIFHENGLPAEDSHEISCLIFLENKERCRKICRLLQIIGGALWVKVNPFMTRRKRKSENFVCWYQSFIFLLREQLIFKLHAKKELSDLSPHFSQG